MTTSSFTRTPPLPIAFRLSRETLPHNPSAFEIASTCRKKTQPSHLEVSSTSTKGPATQAKPIIRGKNTKPMVFSARLVMARTLAMSSASFAIAGKSTVMIAELTFEVMNCGNCWPRL